MLDGEDSMIEDDSFIVYRETGYEFQIQKQSNTLGEKLNIVFLV